jgi:hypothetical protein
MERRRLVGRRYEDYLRNKIVIKLTAEELLWRMVFRDPRYNSLIERRTTCRRKTDKPGGKSLTAMKPVSSFMFMWDLGEE